MFHVLQQQPMLSWDDKHRERLIVDGEGHRTKAAEAALMAEDGLLLELQCFWQSLLGAVLAQDSVFVWRIERLIPSSSMLPSSASWSVQSVALKTLLRIRRRRNMPINTVRHCSPMWM